MSSSQAALLNPQFYGRSLYTCHLCFIPSCETDMPRPYESGVSLYIRTLLFSLHLLCYPWLYTSVRTARYYLVTTLRILIDHARGDEPTPHWVLTVLRWQGFICTYATQPAPPQQFAGSMS